MAQSLQEIGMEVAGLYVVGPTKIWAIESVAEVTFDWAGIAGDRHYGMTRILQPDESVQLANLEVANDKQLSIVSDSDMVAAAEGLGLPIDAVQELSEKPIAQFMAEQLAANMRVSEAETTLNDIASAGIILTFGDTPDDVSAALRLTEYNEPCKKPLVNLISSLGGLGLSLPGDFDEQKQRFKSVLADRRGWVASVYRTGQITIGQSIFSHQPVALPRIL